MATAPHVPGPSFHPSSQLCSFAPPLMHHLLWALPACYFGRRKIRFLAGWAFWQVNGLSPPLSVSTERQDLQQERAAWQDRVLEGRNHILASRNSFELYPNIAGTPAAVCLKPGICDDLIPSSVPCHASTELPHLISLPRTCCFTSLISSSALFVHLWTNERKAFLLMKINVPAF